MGRSSDGLIFTSALIPPRNNPDRSSSIFSSLSLSFCSPLGTLDARRFCFPLPFPRPYPYCRATSTSGGSPSRKRKKKKKGKNQREGTSSYPSPSRTRCISALPSSRLRLNTIHCTAPSCLFTSVLLSRYLHALRFAV